MLAGVLGPTSGKILIAGNDILESPIRARSCIGYLAEASPLYPEMRVGDYLKYRAALKGINRKGRVNAVQEVTTLTHCRDVIDCRIAHLSHGYRQRVGLADTLLANPPVLLLDEPTAGLDPNQIREVRELVVQLGQSRTILLSTHVLAEVEAVCTEAVVIHRGQLVAHESLDVLRASRQGADVTLLVRDPDLLTPKICSNLGWNVRISSDQASLRQFSDVPDVQQFTVFPASSEETIDKRLEALVATLVQSGVGIRGVHRASATLEAVFAELTAEGGAPPL